MAEFKRASLTQKGLALLAKAQTGGAPITITAAVSGSGTYTADEDISQQTALKEQKQEFAPSSVKRQNDSYVFIRFSITNCPPDEPLTVGYNVTEIGIMAQDPDEGEVLYAIATLTPDGGPGDRLPAYDGSMPTAIGVNFLIEVANAESVTIQTDISAYVTMEELDERAIYWNGEQESVTVFNADGSISETTEEGTKTTVFNQDGSITESYPDGRVLVTVFNQDGSITRTLQAEEDDES